MEQMLFGFQGVELSFDDIIIHANTLEELIDMIHVVFERYVGICQFKVKSRQMSVWFNRNAVLGYVISAESKISNTFQLYHLLSSCLQIHQTHPLSVA